MRAIAVAEPGGPEVLHLTEADIPTPGPGQLLVQVAAAGVNFIDTYRRSGVYPWPMPHIPGSEGAGRVVEQGPGAEPWWPAIGTRVAWADSATGSYAEFAVVDADKAVELPDSIDDETAAALPLQGMTAHYLTQSTFPLAAGHVALIHAAAGGVGLLATQLARRAGAVVIGTAGSAVKADAARVAGADHVVRYDEFDSMTAELPAAVRAIAPEGAHVVYDGVGAATFDGSLASLRPRGMLVLFGGASGQVPPFDLQRLNSGGSLFVTRPTLAHYVATRAELLERTAVLFDAVGDGWLHVTIGERLPLAEASRAHSDLEHRRTSGKVVLTM